MKKQVFKQVIFLCVYLMIFGAFAQKKVILGINQSFDFLSRDFESAQHVQPGFLINGANPNYAVGLNAERVLNTYISLSTGINYSKQSFSQALVCHVCDVIGDVIPFTAKQTYLQVPVGISYKIMDKDFSPTVGLGGISNFLMTTNLDEADGNQEVNKFYFAGYLTVGFVYEIADNLVLSTGYRKSQSITDVVFPAFNYKQNGGYLGIGMRL